jgi:arginyl-tRNA synthetase
MLRGDVADELGRRIAAAVEAAYSLEIGLEEAAIRPAPPERPADYQSNAAMPLAKRLSLPSRQVAAAIVEHFETGDMVEPPEVSGPGFVNLALRRDWLERHLRNLSTDDRLGVAREETPRRVVVDYSSPNAAKEMHAGHLRSTILGDALVRLLRFAGHEVIPQNHLGDWGTPFGMLVEELIDRGWAGSVERQVRDLNAFYQEVRARFDSDPEFAERARRRVVALQAGDPQTVAVWHELIGESIRQLEDLYRFLGVLLRPEDIRPESSYEDVLPEVVRELEEAGLAVPSEGALCVFPPGFTSRDGEPLPLIVRKGDGGYTYDTTDLAALRYRTLEMGADRLLYVVGASQRLHFEMLFAVARLAGWLGARASAEHVSFGAILGPDGKMLRTRAGAAIKLIELLQEAVDRAASIVAERAELDPDERERVARAVGIGALKYADLSSDREKDYVFSWDRMLAMDGNTAVYLQYANARIRSILRRGAEGGKLTATHVGTGILLARPAERALALKLAQFPAAVQMATARLQPHRICTYLYEAATAFSTFYEHCSVLNAETAELRASRLALSEVTSRTLTLGLGLLGIEAPERL